MSEWLLVAPIHNAVYMQLDEPRTEREVVESISLSTPYDADSIRIAIWDLVAAGYIDREHHTLRRRPDRKLTP